MHFSHVRYDELYIRENVRTEYYKYIFLKLKCQLF